MIEYKIIQECGFIDFERQFNKLTKDGWLPFYNCKIVERTSNGDILYTQMFSKYIQTTNN